MKSPLGLLASSAPAKVVDQEGENNPDDYAVAHFFECRESVVHFTIRLHPRSNVLERRVALHFDAKRGFGVICVKR